SALNVSRRRWVAAWRAETLAAASWSAQKPGRCISCSSFATPFARPPGSKVVREQLQPLAYLLDALGDATVARYLGHGSSIRALTGGSSRTSGPKPRRDPGTAASPAPCRRATRAPTPSRPRAPARFRRATTTAGG